MTRDTRSSRRRFLQLGSGLFLGTACYESTTGIGSTDSRDAVFQGGQCPTYPSPDEDGPLTVPYDTREKFGCLGRELDDFEDLSQWTTYDGNVAPMTENPFTGTQSARMVAKPKHEAAWVGQKFPNGLDVTSHGLSLAVRFPEAESKRRPKWPKKEQLLVELLAPDWQNHLKISRHFYRAGWQQLNLGPAEAKGNPNLRDVTEVRVHFWTGGGSELEVYVDSLRLLPNRRSGKVMLTFDDNARSQYTTAFPLMQERNMPGVVGVIPRTVGYENKIPLSGMREMQSAGWDMVSHPQRDRTFSQMRPDKQRSVMRSSKRWLVENGFEDGARFMVWPYGVYDESSLRIASNYHYCSFEVGGSPITTPFTSPQLIPRVDGSDVAATKEMVDWADRLDRLLVVMYHDIGAEGYVSKSGLRETLDYVQQSDLDVTTASQLWSELAPGDATTTSSTQTRGSITRRETTRSETTRSTPQSETTQSE